MRFRYLNDPLFVFCVILYFVNRLVLKRWFSNEFSRDYLNDVICIPFWIPIMLFMMRKVRLRATDQPPSGSEILIPLILWSWVFEAYLPFVPFFRRLATSDYRDILSYTIGGLFAALFWRIWYRLKLIEQ
jgi:membrane protein CcdC involved in cytochrome C biogenesis